MTPAPDSQPVSVDPKPAASEHFWHAVNCAAASATAVGISHLFGFDNPLYSLVAAVIVSDAPAEQMKLLGYHRIIGNGMGAVVGALMVMGFGHSVYVVSAAVLVMMFVCYRLGLNDAAKIAAYVAGIVVMAYGEHPWIHARDRFVETTIGIICAYCTSQILYKIMERRREQATEHLPD